MGEYLEEGLARDEYSRAVAVLVHDVREDLLLRRQRWGPSPQELQSLRTQREQVKARAQRGCPGSTPLSPAWVSVTATSAASSLRFLPTPPTPTSHKIAEFAVQKEPACLCTPPPQGIALSAKA